MAIAPHSISLRSAKVEIKKSEQASYLESNLLPLENSVPVCVREGRERFLVTSRQHDTVRRSTVRGGKTTYIKRNAHNEP